MSFDLAVWRSETIPSDGEAGETYLLLCDDMCGGGPVEPGVEELYTELTRRYPEIDSVPEEEVDDCPWSVQLNRSGHDVIMSAVWSRSDEIRAFVLDLAKKYGLILYDPQKGKVLWPEQSAKIRLTNLFRRK
jgi:hypothetical protein